MHDTHQRAVLTVYCPAGVGTDRLVKSAPSRRLEMSQTFISSRIHATDRTMKHTFWYKMNKKKAKTVPIKNEKSIVPAASSSKRLEKEKENVTASNWRRRRSWTESNWRRRRSGTESNCSVRMH